MDNRDKNFFIALAYTASTEKNLDIITFSQKVTENLEKLSAEQQKQPLPKAKFPKRSELGI